MHAAEHSKDQAILELQTMRIELTQTNRDSEEIRNTLRNVEACVDGWKEKCCSAQAERDQLAAELAGLQAPTGQDTPITQYVEGRQEIASDSDEVRQLEERIETLQDNLDAATNALSNRDQDHELVLLAKDQTNDAKMAELKEIHNKEIVRSKFIPLD